MPRYAAIDIGSNSIRMEAAEVTPGQPIRVLASEREVTRLGESVFRTRHVRPGARLASAASGAHKIPALPLSQLIRARARSACSWRDGSSAGSSMIDAGTLTGLCIGHHVAAERDPFLDREPQQPRAKALLIDLFGHVTQRVERGRGDAR